MRRRGFRSPYDSSFKDVTYLGLLATDYLMRGYGNRTWGAAPKSMWDELFARHQREREELLRWEERHSTTKLKRYASTDTIKQDYEHDESDAGGRSRRASDAASEHVDMVKDVGDQAGRSDEWLWRNGTGDSPERSSDVDMMPVEGWGSCSKAQSNSPSPQSSRSSSSLAPFSPRASPKRKRLSRVSSRSNGQSAAEDSDDDLNGADLPSWLSVIDKAAHSGDPSGSRPMDSGRNSIGGGPRVGGMTTTGANHAETTRREVRNDIFSDSESENDFLSSGHSDGYATSSSSSWDIVSATGHGGSPDSLSDIDFDSSDIYVSDDEGSVAR